MRRYSQMLTLFGRHMVIARGLSLVATTFVICVTSELSLAQPAPSQEPIVIAPTIDPVEFTESGRTYIWKRHPGIDWVLLFGCGGGGGGAPGSRFGITSANGGHGGSAQHPSTALAGPLTAPEYSILVGRGGTSGSGGSPTTFHDGKVTFQFDGAPGGGQQTGPNAAGSPGGNSFFGSGGAGGPEGSNGEIATARCAGGGGAGGPNIGKTTQGGSGGPGYLVLYTLRANQLLRDFRSEIMAEIDKVLTPELRKEITDDAVAKARSQILDELKKQGVIAQPENQ
jgi:hypothetical protein